MPDQEVHEIQLNGKQLVFMFGAATMVSVVIFLCGVMVGRGVRQVQPDVLAASTDSAIDPAAPFETTTSRSALPADPAPAPAQETLTYAEPLEAPLVPDEPLKLAEASKPAVAPAVDDKKAAPKAVPAQETKQPAAPKAPAAVKVSATKPDAVTAGSHFVEPPGNGFVVQVGVFPTLEAAEAQRRPLVAKGYNVFLTLNPDATKAKYRVRVGRYATKGEADAVAAKLRQEARVKPWVTR
jgi:DedD protein